MTYIPDCQISTACTPEDCPGYAECQERARVMPCDECPELDCTWCEEEVRTVVSKARHEPLPF